jgi:predicted metal-dependent phosphoesterase TrpH
MNFIKIPKADLHCHSYFSDGDCSPADILQMAIAQDVDILALTDHDSVEGYTVLHELAKDFPQIKIIPGIECSVTWQRMELHVVALNIDIHHHDFIQYLELQSQKRQLRALNITKALNKLGIDLNYSDIVKLAGHSNVSRTHFAKYLVENHIVPDMASAFKTYLGSRAPAYIPPQWASIEETVALIRMAGGVAIIAHPMHYQLSTAQLKNLFQHFKFLGGKGIEVISGIMNLKDMRRLIKLAYGLGLSLSSGSDFHRLAPYRAKIGGQTEFPKDCIPIWLDGTFETI